MVMPKTYEVLMVLFKDICENGIACKILGNGSNILVSDEGFNGVVISLKDLPSSVEFIDGRMNVSAKIDGAYLCKKCILEGLSNLEFIAGIPGTIGGLVAMNAGAFGKEISTYLSYIKLITDAGEEKIINKEEIHFGYRCMNVQSKNFIITEASFFMDQKTMQEVKKTCDDYLQQRKSKDLWQKNTFGSTFKNGANYYAGELIEKCGLKGFRIGGAMISKDHANFIINDNDATSKDIFLLIQKMKEEVKKKFSVDLEPEVHLWGDFSYAK